ncbi:type I-A CRISPR-associated protein Csa5 [Acidianus brierleyi]|uniref:Type I-A CRISPR-associated protein Csa5 n=1 Tax=Acidianus brierleyi TaxID=41673 RepID=A0A2U9IGQ8_9CREN|nr:type I-A CRISPR-associated protein Csa5 [Acidianus brierleyi]AWR95232.1 type I-A CRISPR-associated protein Csa5 [Acidianus brierleyi]
MDEGVLKRIANLLATSSLYTDSPTLIDRIANALSKEAITKVLNDSQRIIESGISKGDIFQNKKDDHPIISIKGEKMLSIYGYLPTTSDIENFLLEVEKDIYNARKAGAIAMSIVNQAKLGGNQ